MASSKIYLRLKKALPGLLFLLFIALPQQAEAHCDSYDGPVIKDALKALELKDVNPVLKWVEQKDEAEISALFEKTLKYQKQDPEIYELIKKHFLETLVRVHRESEGEPYTGLKPAGTTAPIIIMTDAALEKDDFENLMGKLNGHTERVLREKFEKMAQLKKVKDASVENGRAYVAAYVDYTHSIEALHKVLEHSESGHGH